MSAKARSALIGIELLTATGIIVFWALFFLVGGQETGRPRCYLAFEYAFPAPDLILAISLAASTVLLLRERAWGKALSLICAGALMFLGLVDTSFSTWNGVYRTLSADALLDAAINFWCIVASIVIVGLLRPSTDKIS